MEKQNEYFVTPGQDVFLVIRQGWSKEAGNFWENAQKEFDTETTTQKYADRLNGI